MNVLLIGGNGFIGSHLVDYLVSKNHSVRVFDISFERYRKPNLKVDYRIFDINNSQALFEAMLEIDVVFHLASGSVPSSSNLDFKRDIQNNLFSTLNILENMVKSGVNKLVYLSSGGAVYGNSTKTKIAESSALTPISGYGINKVSCEHYIRLYETQYNIKSLIVRPSNPYGPRQGHFVAQGVISTFLRKTFKNEPLTIFGDGENKKDYIYIDDLIHHIYNLFANETEGTFNIGSGEGTSINQIITIIKKTANPDLKINYEAFKNYDVKDFVLDISKLESVSRIKPISMNRGIEMTWNWIQEQNNLM